MLYSCTHMATVGVKGLTHRVLIFDIRVVRRPSHQVCTVVQLLYVSREPSTYSDNIERHNKHIVLLVK